MQKKNTARGFGPKYGTSVRNRWGAVETKRRKEQKCPFCKKNVKRVAAGIWKCKFCGKKFASGAYYLSE